MIDIAFTVAALALLVAAALCDAATRLIPNTIPLALLVIGIVDHAVNGHLGWALAAGLAVFAVFVLLWRYHLVGGGDVKLVGAAVVALPLSSIASFLLAVALAGGVLAIFYLCLQQFVRRPAPGRRRSLLRRILKAEGWRISHRGSIPYAVAIATGGLVVLLPGLAPLF